MNNYISITLRVTSTLMVMAVLIMGMVSIDRYQPYMDIVVAFSWFIFLDTYKSNIIQKYGK